MKTKTLAILIILFSQLAQGQQKVVVDYNGALLPNLTIKRGDMFRAEVNDNGTKSTIDALVDQGYDFYLGHRNYNEQSSSKFSCGIPTEFYKDGVEIKYRLNQNMTDLRTYAKSKQIQVFQQFNRVPLSGNFTDAVPEGTYDIFTFQQGWYRDGEVAKGRPDGLLPIKEQYAQFADVVSKYIIACDEASGINSIWTGFDEPAHTLGFLEGQNDDPAKEENVRRYVEFFAPLAIKLKEAGKTIGGIQLNAANAAPGLYSVATSELKSRGAYIDYFTIQNYLGGTSNATVISKSRQALSDPYWKDTKVFFNRYGYWKNSYEDPNNLRNTSREMVAFLEAEKIIVDNADIMYGYAMEAKQFSDNVDKMLGQLGIFLNKMPIDRKSMTFENANLNGFSSANGSELMAIIWNKSGTSSFPQFKLQLSNLPVAFDNLSIRKGSGTALTDVQSYQWDKNTNTISGITLSPYDFLLVTIKNSSSQTSINETDLSNSIYFYPNPARTNLQFGNTTGTIHVTVYSLNGQLLKDEYLTSSNELSIEDLPTNMYILKVQDLFQTKTFKLSVQ